MILPVISPSSCSPILFPSLAMVWVTSQGAMATVFSSFMHTGGHTDVPWLCVGLFIWWADGVLPILAPDASLWRFLKQEKAAKRNRDLQVELLNSWKALFLFYFWGHFLLLLRLVSVSIPPLKYPVMTRSAQQLNKDWLFQQHLQWHWVDVKEKLAAAPAV